MKLASEHSANTPSAHASFLGRAIGVLQKNRAIVGVAVAGSYASATMDEFSDLDLVIAVEPEAVADITIRRQPIAEKLGTLVASFSGEHVGEPRLLICLYASENGHPPLHVDLKFLALPDAAARVDNPAVVWERDGRLSQVFQKEEAQFPQPNLPWIEDRFWVWVHYACLKIGRGELFETIDFLGFLRTQVLGPLALVEAAAQPAGVRRLETAAPKRALQMEETLAAHSRTSCIQSLYAAVNMYRSLRESVGAGQVVNNVAAEATALEYLAEIAKRHQS